MVARVVLPSDHRNRAAVVGANKRRWQSPKCLVQFVSSESIIQVSVTNEHITYQTHKYADEALQSMMSHDVYGKWICQTIRTQKYGWRNSIDDALRCVNVNFAPKP